MKQTQEKRKVAQGQRRLGYYGKAGSGMATAGTNMAKVKSKGRYRLSNMFCGTVAAAAKNMMFESLRKNACGTNCRRGWAELAFCGKECLCVRPENRQFLVHSTAIQLCLGTYLQHVLSMFADCPHQRTSCSWLPHQAVPRNMFHSLYRP